MSNNKVIVLPDSEEMMRRLVEGCDIDYYKERFYPLLLKHAGQRKTASGVVIIFSLAISDFAKDMLPVIATQLYMLLPDLIDAIIDDKEIVEEAKVFLAQSQQRSAQ